MILKKNKTTLLPHGIETSEAGRTGGLKPSDRWFCGSSASRKSARLRTPDEAQQGWHEQLIGHANMRLALMQTTGGSSQEKKRLGQRFLRCRRPWPKKKRSAWVARTSARHSFSPLIQTILDCFGFRFRIRTWF